MENNQVPRYRRAGMKVLDTATTIAGAKSVTDTQCGFRAYSRRVIDLLHITGAGMSGDSEILIQAGGHNLNIAEVPVNVRYDIEGTSTLNPVSHGVSIVSRLISLISSPVAAALVWDNRGHSYCGWSPDRTLGVRTIACRQCIPRYPCYRECIYPDTGHASCDCRADFECAGGDYGEGEMRETIVLWKSRAVSCGGFFLQITGTCVLFSSINLRAVIP